MRISGYMTCINVPSSVFAALNDFLAKRFGSQDAAFASAPPQHDASADTKQPSEGPSTPESDAAVPGLDETDIDDGDSDVPPIPAANVDEDTKTVEPKTDETDVKGTREGEKEAESPYIAGVREVEDDEEEEEEEEPEETVKEERTPDAEPVRAEEKVTETADTSDKDSQQEDDTEVETVEPSDRVNEEAAVPAVVGSDQTAEPTAVGSDQSSTGSTVAQSEDKSGEATTSQGSIVEPGDRAGEQDVVKQDVEEMMSKGVPAADIGTPADQKAEGEVKIDTQNTVKVDAATVATPDVSVDAGAAGGSAPDAVSVDTNAADGSAAQQKEQEELLFQSEMEDPEDEEDREEEEEEGEEENPAVFHTDTLDALTQSHLKDAGDEGVKEGNAEDKVLTGQADLANQGTVQERPAIQPDKTVSEPAVPSAPTSHQPVDIDFVAGQVQDSGIPLESSQTAVDQQVAAETPTLEGTPSIQQAAQGMFNTAVPSKTEDAQPAQSGTGDQIPTTVIDGTKFYLENGEIADIVPESGPAQETTTYMPTPKEPDVSLPPAQATQPENIQPTGVTVLPEMSLQEAVVATSPPPLNGNIPDPTPQTAQKVQNTTEGAAAGSLADQPDVAKIADPVQQRANAEQYQTSADFLSRRVLSVNSQVPGQVPQHVDGAQQIPAQEQGIQKTLEQQGNTQAPQAASEESPAASDSATKEEVPASDTLAQAEVPASEIEPSASVDVGAASVTIEGEELAQQFIGGEDQRTGEEEKPGTEGEDAAATTSEPVSSQGDASSPLPPEAEDGASSSDPENVQEEKTESVQAENAESVTPPPDTLAWDGVPPPPTADEVTPSPGEQVI